MGPILVSYVYEEKGTYLLFGLCAASLLATGIVTLAAFRLSHKTHIKLSQNSHKTLIHLSYKPKLICIHRIDYHNFYCRHLVPPDEEMLGGDDDEEGANLQLIETKGQKMETEKRPNFEQKLEDKTQEAMETVHGS